MISNAAWLTPFDPTSCRRNWTAAMVGSIAFHAALAATFWPGSNELALSGAPILTIDLALIDEAGDKRATPPAPSIPVATQPVPPEEKTETVDPDFEPREKAVPDEPIPAPPALAAPLPSHKPTPVAKTKPANVPAQTSPNEQQTTPTAGPISTDREKSMPHTAAPGSMMTSQTAASVPQASSGREPMVVFDPKFLRQPTPPSYPSRAVELDQQGVVFIRALVVVPGKPKQTVVWQSSGFPLLDSAAMAAVSRWEFEPLRLAGEAQPAWVQVPVKFRLN